MSSAKVEGRRSMKDPPTSGPAPGGPARTSGMVYVVFISLVIDLLAFTVILPLLPSLLDYYGQKEDGLYQTLLQSIQGFRAFVGAPDTPRWNSVFFGGLIGSLFSLLQFVASPVIGACSDYYGRRPVMLISLVGVALSYVVWALSGNFTIFVVARIIGGVSKGNVSLCTAVVADVSTKETRNKGMALIGIAFSVGFILGPLIGAYFAKVARTRQDQFYVAPALFALTLAMADIIFVSFWFKETLPPEKRSRSVAGSVQEATALINPVSLFRFSAVKRVKHKEMQALQGTGVVYFLYLFFYSGLEFTLTFLTHNKFNYDSMQQGKMFVFIGVLMALVQGGYVRQVKAGRETAVARTGMVVLIPAFLLIGFSYSSFQLYSGLALFAFASASVVPCLTSLISVHGHEDQKGTVLGIFRSLGALARALGPVVMSTVYWSVGAETCYLVGGLGLILPLVLLSSVKHHTD